ncbi:hypothetical protein FACS1894123_05190 [Bacteroidia bacterium]|nr:hypothetical protein FACS1894123_05190 [Bacteroidia bacterium]
MKYLIVGLGNPGNEYAGTRHNIGFMILDAFAKASNVVFDVNKRYGAVCEMRLKNKQLLLLKPYTYMNLSGNNDTDCEQDNGSSDYFIHNPQTSDIDDLP